jgi:Tol biopolymer transport system component
MTRTGLALLIVLLAALAAAPTAGATFPGKPGPIVFYDLSDGSGLWTIGPSGGEARKAPFQGSHDPRRSDPAYSADGRFVAYPSAESGLHVAEADGSDARRVVDSNAFEPAWSPDGRRLAITRMSEDNYPMLHVLDLATGEIRFLTPGESPSWSPNGKLIAYDEVGDSRLCRIRPTGGGRSCFSAATKLGAHDPDWSPGGRAIAVAARGRIAVLSSGGRFSRWVSPPLETSRNVSTFEPSWSPDGRRIVYERGKGQYRGSLYVTSDRGGRQRFLTTGINPVWSPRP